MRLGVVGAGAMGARVGAVAALIDGVQVTAVADPNEDRAEALADTLDARAYSSMDDLVASGQVDAVYIGVPHDQHLAACTAAAGAGLHILIDKPLCNTMDEANAIIAARNASGVKLMVGFSYRFRAEWIRARDLIGAGAIGRPRFVADTLVEAESSTPAWYWDATAGGGVLQLQSHHCFDRLSWILGDRVAEVGCRTSALAGDAEDVAIINAQTDAGVLMSIDISFGRTHRAPSHATTTIQGDRGHIVIGPGRTLRIEAEGEDPITVDHTDDDWLRTELSAFAALCRGEEGDVPDAVAGRTALACALLAAASAREGGAPLRLA